MLVFLIKLLKSTHKEDHPFSIIKLIQKDDFTSVDIESILNVINNLYHRVYFLLEIYNKNKIIFLKSPFFFLRIMQKISQKNF